MGSASRVGINRSTVREKVRVARALSNLPRLTAALARGVISYSKVREVTRVATPENKAELVELCQARTALQVQRIVRAAEGGPLPTTVSTSSYGAG